MNHYLPSADEVSVTHKRKRVTFAPLAAIQRTIHVDDFSMEERQAYWLSRFEKAQVRQSAEETVAKLSKGETACCCARGLEVYVSEKARFRKANRRKASVAVFVVQQRQQEQGYVSDDEISLAYGVHTFQSQQEALEFGIADERECNGRETNSSRQQAPDNEKGYLANSRLGRLLPRRRFVSSKQQRQH